MPMPESAPAKTAHVMPTDEFDIDGDIDKLREQFKEYLSRGRSTFV